MAMTAIPFLEDGGTAGAGATRLSSSGRDGRGKASGHTTIPSTQINGRQTTVSPFFACRCCIMWRFERHPRNWEQILLTWVKAAAVLLAIRPTFLLLLRQPEWLTHLP